MRVNVGRMRQTGRILLDALEGPKVQLRDTLRKIDSSSQPLPLLVVPPTLSPSPSPSPSNFPSSPLLPPTYTHTRTPRSRPSHIAPRGVWRSAAHFLFSPAAEQSYHSCRKTMAAASLLARTSRSVATRGAWTQLKTQHAATYAIPLLLIHRRHQTLTAMPSQQQNTRALGLGQILCLQMYAQQILLMPLNTALTPFEQPTHHTPSYPCLPSPPR